MERGSGLPLKPHLTASTMISSPNKPKRLKCKGCFSPSTHVILYKTGNLNPQPSIIESPDCRMPERPIGSNYAICNIRAKLPTRSPMGEQYCFRGRCACLHFYWLFEIVSTSTAISSCSIRIRNACIPDPPDKRTVNMHISESVYQSCPNSRLPEAPWHPATAIPIQTPLTHFQAHLSGPEDGKCPQSVGRFWCDFQPLVRLAHLHRPTRGDQLND